MKRVYELDIYKLAEKLSDMVWHGFDKWDKRVQNNVGYQTIRSSDNIAVNIAEGVNFRLSFRGYGRYTSADRKKFYLYSSGSLEETKSWLRKLIRRKVLSEPNTTEYKAIVKKRGPQLNAFINSTKT
ncbi:MAG: four helix bundle protein [Deltaproteobacteria bacterium]|nr:four helix bundle protein [Deltaproteobacteria bacterium]MBW2201941.1 four helix bundle protein [Deltaproteobacteria bacterium]